MKSPNESNRLKCQKCSNNMFSCVFVCARAACVAREGGGALGMLTPATPADPWCHVPLISVAPLGGNRMVKHYVRGN